MLDLSVIILTKNEEIHIERCLENIMLLTDKVFIIDSYSDDMTVNICEKRGGVKVVRRKWPGSWSNQFNWALDNLEIKTKWVLRIDADEYLLPELIDEVRNKEES